MDVLIFLAYLVNLVGTVKLQFVGQRLVGQCEHLDGKEPGIACTGDTDGHGCNGHTARHLDG